MAIFNVNNSSLNSYLNESDRMLKKYRSEPDNVKTDILGLGHRNFSKYTNEKLKDSFINNSKAANIAKKNRSTDDDYALNGSFYREEAKNAGKELKKRGYNPKAIREKGKKEQEKIEEIRNNRRKKLKEAAEYILSVLDESEKKIE